MIEEARDLMPNSDLLDIANNMLTIAWNQINEQCNSDPIINLNRMMSYLRIAADRYRQVYNENSREQL